MTFSFFTKNSQDKNLALLVDVGSSSVGCALARLEKGRVPHVLFTTRESISFQESLSSVKFLLAMNHALGRALKTIQEKTGIIGAPNYFFCTLSSPWFILKSRHLSVVRQEPFKVTERSLEEFINEDIEHLKEELKETLPPKDVVIIEKKIIQIKLNGYDIKNPYDQMTARLEIAMTVGVSSDRVIESIKRKLGQFLHSTAVHFGAFPIAAFSAVRDIFPTENNFLFLDITGEATDVSLVNGDILAGTVSFSRGKNFFIRETSTQFRTLHEEAATLFAMYLRNELPSDKHALVEGVVVRAEKEWLTRFEKVVATLANSGALPRKVFFTTDADIAVFFSRLITAAKTEFLMSESFEAQYLDQLIVAKFVSFEHEVAWDSFLVVEALLAQKVISSHN
ncbi:MAG: hypothetical protein HZB12_03305 [Candidatus Yonathbacteria bacterium]|nr:hypothetical protein [Candidatus Yonathbacteria bacterium]